MFSTSLFINKYYSVSHHSKIPFECSISIVFVHTTPLSLTTDSHNTFPGSPGTPALPILIILPAYCFLSHFQYYTLSQWSHCSEYSFITFPSLGLLHCYYNLNLMVHWLKRNVPNESLLNSHLIHEIQGVPKIDVKHYWFWPSRMLKFIAFTGIQLLLLPLDIISPWGAC